jgi:hypothetical protein
MSLTLIHRAVLMAAASTFMAVTAQAAAAPLDADLSTWTCLGQCGSSPADGDVTLSPLGNARYGYLTTAESAALHVSPLNISESGGSGSTFTDTNGTLIRSAAFDAQAGDTVSAYFNYVSTDGKGFDDYAWARLTNASDNSLVAWMFTARSTNSSKQSIVPGDLKVGFDPDATLLNYADFNFQTRNLDGSPVSWAALGNSNGTCWRNDAEGCGFTGWLQSQVTLSSAGRYRLEIGVVNFGDQAFDSGLAFDMVNLKAASSTVPEPGTLAMALPAWMLMSLVAAARRRSVRQPV